MAGKITTLQRRLTGCERHIKQCFAMVELIIFECVKLGNIWKNDFMFSKLCMCDRFTIDKMQNMCKLVNLYLEVFCQIRNGNWLVVRSYAMVYLVMCLVS